LAACSLVDGAQHGLRDRTQSCTRAGRTLLPGTGGAAEAVRRWHEAGHWIHVTSHRRDSCAPATKDWLEVREIPYHDLHCSFDKITRCVELGIDLLVDDSPVNISRARQEGMLAATIIHPWNKSLVGEDGVIAAETWAELEPLVDERLRRL